MSQSLVDRQSPSADGETGAGLPAEPVRELTDIGRMFHDRSWSLGTSSNYSVVLRREPLELLITASGRDKRRSGQTTS